MTILERIEKLESLKERLKYRTDISKEEYKKFKEFYSITIDYWKEQLELENEHLL